MDEAPQHLHRAIAVAEHLRGGEQMRRFPSAMSCEMMSPASMVLPRPDFVCQDAAAFRDAAQGEDHGVDLVRVGIDPAAALTGGVAALVVRPAQADQVFRKEPATDGA